MKIFLKFFAIQFLVYAIYCWNSRAMAMGRLFDLAASDLVYAGLQFHVIQEVAKAAGHAARWGYILGGVAGSLVSVVITKHVWGI